MANWWDEAPRADPEPQRSGGNWWEAAPTVPRQAAPAPAAALGDAPRDPVLHDAREDEFATGEGSLRDQNRRFVEESTFAGRLRDNIRRGWLGLRANLAAGPRMPLIERGAEATTTGDVMLGTDPIGMPIYASQAYTARQLPGVADAYRELGAAAGEDLARRVSPLQAEMAEIPRRPATDALLGAETFGEGLSALATDPLGVIGDIGVPSTVQMAPALAASAVVRRPVFTAGAMGATSSINEFGASVVGYLSEQGVDVSDPQALQAALADPELVSAAVNEARVRSGIIGSVDAASGGLAGRTLVPQALARNAATREAVNVLGAQPAVQAAMGAGGEAAAQFATRGEIQPGEVLAEALGEFFMSPAEVGPFAAQRMYDAARGRGQGALGDPPAGSPPPQQPPPAAPQPAALDDLLLRNVPTEQPAQDQGGDPPAGAGSAQPIPTQAAPSAPAPPPPASTETAGGPSGPVQSLPPRADAAMQNRDRSRTASVAQMQDISRNPDPARLGFSRDANTGAPMVQRGQEVPAGDLGRTDAVVMPDGRRVPVQYAVVEADAVQASHDADGNVNPAYDGAPLQALNNGRTAGLQAAWQAGNAHAYRDGLAADADFHGVPAEAIAGKRQPVLVRLYDPAENLSGAQSNLSQQLGLSPVEQAQTDATMLPDLSGIQWAEDGSLNPATNANFFRAWFSNMGETQAATLQDAQGRPNAAALQRVRAAMVQRAYGDERLLTALVEDTNPDNRNVMTALVQAAPAFASLDEGNAVGGEIRAALTGGLQMLRDAAERGISLTDAVAQQDMFGRNPEADAVAGFMAANARSAKRMAEAFRAMAEYAGRAEQQAATLDVFGTAPTPTVADARRFAGMEEDSGRVERDEGAPVRDGEGQPGEQAPGRTAAGDARVGERQDGYRVAEEQPGLFAEPTRREEVDAERRRRDAERDGRTGAGRTDMAAGPGDLFAGRRPQQARIPDRVEESGDQTQTPEFRRWFGDSKVVDANGAPLVMHHATDADFDTFIAQPHSDIGFHFGSEEAALARADQLRDGIGRRWDKGAEKTLAVYLSIKNPLRVSDYSMFTLQGRDVEGENFIWELRDAGVQALPGMSNAEAIRAIEAAGYDGLVYENIWEGGGDSYAALRPNQIKSATDNRGTFDPNDPSILREGGDSIPYVATDDSVAGGQGARAAGDDSRRSANVDDATGLPLNDDGTVTVYHHTSGDRAASIRRDGSLRADAEPDVYVTTRAETDTGYGDTAVPIRVDPARLELDDEFPNGRRDFRLNVGRPGGSIRVSVENDPTASDSPDAPRVEASRDMFVPTRGDQAQTGGRDAQDQQQRRDGGVQLDAYRRGDNARPDFSPELARRAANAIDEIVRRAGGTVLADSLRRDFEANQAARLIGLRAETEQDFATIAQVYRNPLFETLHYVFVDDAGTVLGETAISDRMPAAASAFPSDIGNATDAPVRWLKSIMPPGTTGLWMVHNHPSGNPTPSGADRQITTALNNLLRQHGGPRLRGHVVLNHQTYGRMAPDGSVRPNANVPGAPAADPLRQSRGGILDEVISGPSSAASVGRKLADMVDDDSVSVIATGAQNNIVVATSVPGDYLNTARGAGFLSMLGTRSGATAITLVGSTEALNPITSQGRNSAIARRNLVRDVIVMGSDGIGNSLASVGRWEMGYLGEHTRARKRRAARGMRVFEGGARVESRQDSYTPAQEEFMRKAGVGRDTRGTLKKARDWLRGAMPDFQKDPLIQGAIDQYYAIKQAVKGRGLDIENDPYVAARMVNIASTMEAVLRFGAPKMEGGVLRVDRSIPGLFDALTPVHDKLPAFFGWMVARRAHLLRQQGRENLMSDADIRAGLSLRNGNEAAFDKAAGDYLRLKNAILDFAEKHGGTIDPAARAAWDHAEYIPFYREADSAGFSGPGTRRGLSNQTAGIRKLKGGEQALRDPLANIMQNFTRIMDSALKNRAMQLAVDQLGAPYFKKLPMKVAPATIPLDQVKRHLLAQGVPQATFDAMPSSAIRGVGRMLAIEAPTGDNVVRLMREGRPEYYEVEDPLLLRAVTAMHDTPTPNWIRPMTWAKNLLTAGATSTPDFLLRNTLRDTGEAAVTSRETFVPVWDTLRGAVESTRMSEFTQDLMMAGSYFHGGLFHQGDHEATARATRRALRRHGLTDSQAEKVAKTLINPKRWWDVYRAGLEASEMGSRVRLARNRMDATGNFLESAFEAKDFLDFQLRGDSQVMQFFVRVIPFLNARLQGNYRLARTATAADRKRAVLGRMASMALATTALYAWNMLAYRDGYEELEDWDKDAYWHFAPGTDRHIRIPKPFELGLLAGTTIERGLAAMVFQFTDGEAGDRGKRTASAAWRGLLDTLAMNPIPQVVKPGVEVYFNQNMFTDRPIESRGDEFLPPADRRTPHTSDSLAAASRAMQALLGEDMTLSPKQLQHLWRGYFGGMGMYLLGAVDPATRWLEGAPEKPEKLLRDYPGIGAIYRGGGPPRTTRWVDELYELRAEAMTETAKVKAAAEAGDTARAERLDERSRWLLGDVQSSKQARGGFMHSGVREITRATNEMAKLRKDDNAIYADHEMTPSQKRKALEANAAQRNEIAREMVQRIRRRQHGRDQ